jgi:hypothetical protein
MHEIDHIEMLLIRMFERTDILCPCGYPGKAKQPKTVK